MAGGPWLFLLAAAWCSCASSSSSSYELPEFDLVPPPWPQNANLQWHLNLITILGSEITRLGLETPIAIRATAYMDVMSWNCIASYSEAWLDGLTHERPESRVEDVSLHTSDVRTLCETYAWAYLWPAVFGEPSEAFLSSPQAWALGITADTRLPEDEVDAAGGVAAYVADEGGSPQSVAAGVVMGVLDFASKDGWNSDGSVSRDGSNCTANCHAFRDTTGYEPTAHCDASECWEPLSENDGTGYFTRQEHVTPHIGLTGKSRAFDFARGTRRLAPPEYDYELESVLLLDRLANLTDERKVAIEFFDNKITVVEQLIYDALVAHGDDFSYERFILFKVGLTAAEYDAVLVAWHEKVLHSLVRPPTVIQRTRPDELVTTYAGPYEGVKEIRRADFEPFIRVMPHAEYPSGSGCLCLALQDATEHLFRFILGRTDVDFPLTVVRGANSSRTEPGDVPRATVRLEYTGLDDFRRDCGTTRLEGGMHFTAAVPDSYRLCDGIGAAAAAMAVTLVGSKVPDLPEPSSSSSNNKRRRTKWMRSLLIALGVLLAALGALIGSVALASEQQRKSDEEGDVESRTTRSCEAKEEASSSRRPVVQWRGVTIRYPGERSDAVRDASGRVDVGALSAFVGPSGSGKTSLLQFVTSRLDRHQTAGELFLKGRRVDPGDDVARRAVSYVPQDDSLHPHLRVRESLVFVATLRGEDEARADTLLKLLGLTDKRDSFVGGTLAGGLEVGGLSGGGKRRLTLAIGLVPSLVTAIAADEPVSGLDASAALSVIRAMRDICHESTAVICSIHAPRLALVDFFDSFTFLSAGRLVFSGASAAQALEALDALGFRPKHPIGRGGNPADAVLDLISIDFDKDPKVFGAHTMRTAADVNKAADAFAATPAFQDLHLDLPAPRSKPASTRALLFSSSTNNKDCQHGTQDDDDDDDANNKNNNKRSPLRHRHLHVVQDMPFHTQYWTILKRSVVLHVRHPGNVAARCFLMAATAILCLAVYGRQRCDASFDEVQTSAAAAHRYQVCRSATFSYLLFPALQAFVPLGIVMYERRFFLRESSHRIYSTLSYYLAYVSVESTVVALTNFAVALPFAYAARLSSHSDPGRGTDHLVFALDAVAISLVYSQIVLFAACVSPSADVAFVIASFFFIFGFVTSGFAVRVVDFAPSFKWLSTLSTFKYCYELIVRTLFGPAFAQDEGFRADRPSHIGDVLGLVVFWIALHPPAFLALKHLYRY